MAESQRNGVEPLMPPDIVQTPDARTMVALSERVAVVETKVGALKDDTTVIRSSIHEIKNEQQKAVIFEQQCAAGLNEIKSHMALHAEQMKSHMAIHTDQINSLSAAVADLAAIKMQGEGAWWALTKFVSAIAAIAGAAAVLIGAVFWAFGHLAVQVR